MKGVNAIAQAVAMLSQLGSASRVELRVTDDEGTAVVAQSFVTENEVERSCMTKREVLVGPSCLTRALDDEPIFVLRGKDPCAPSAILAWAFSADVTGAHERVKIAQAYREAREFQEYGLRVAKR